MNAAMLPGHVYAPHYFESPVSDDELLDPDLMIAVAKNIKGRTIARQYCHASSSDSAIEAVLAKASAIGYTGCLAEVVNANWISLDWRKLPWLYPVGQSLDAWLDIQSWIDLAVENNLDPSFHISESAYEYHNDKVSLKLWNLRLGNA